MACAILVLLVLAVTGPAAASDRPAPTMRELAEKVDPLRDDWTSEVFERRASEQLRRLAEALGSGGVSPETLTPLAVPGARSTRLRPADPTATQIAGGIGWFHEGGADDEPTLDLAVALGTVLRPFDDAPAPTIAFKIVRVDDVPTVPITRVRYEARGYAGARRVQQVATWIVSWRATNEGPPLVSSVRLAEFEELSRSGALFTDCTGAALAGDRDVARLALGGEYWYGRIDALGEPPLMGHQGIAIGDVNGDGLEDLYVAMGTGLPNKLYVRGSDGALTDRAAQAGVDWLDDTKGVLFADMDNDGDQDLLCAIGPTIVLAKNDGKGEFERFIGMRAPTPAAFYSLSAADYDLDGDLDVFGARYVKVAYGISIPLPFQDANNGPTNHLMRNDGDDVFSDATVSTGLDAGNTRFSLIGVWADYDDDGDPDLYVANDFGRNNLYRNDGGHFVDVAAEAGAEDQAAGMGVSWTDYDLDGDLDLHVSNMFSAAGQRIAYQRRFQADLAGADRERIRRHSSGNTLLSNLGDGTFADVSDGAGVRMGRWSWGARFVDLNNDGYDDLVVPNGFLTGALEHDL